MREESSVPSPLTYTFSYITDYSCLIDILGNKDNTDIMNDILYGGPGRIAWLIQYIENGGF